jgi:DNA-binding CsgD family transcriptional regulator
MPPFEWHVVCCRLLQHDPGRGDVYTRQETRFAHGEEMQQTDVRSMNGRGEASDATAQDKPAKTGVIILIVAGDPSTPTAQAGFTSLVQHLQQLDWADGPPSIHMVPDEDTGQWLMRAVVRPSDVAAGTDSVAMCDDPDGTQRGEAASDRSAASRWPFVNRRRRMTDRRHGAADSSANEWVAHGPRELPTRTDPPACEGVHRCTDREQQIVELLRQGLTNKQIAQQLGIMEDTVKKHLQHIYDKLGVRRRALVVLGRAGAWMSSGRDPAHS